MNSNEYDLQVLLSELELIERMQRPRCGRVRRLLLRLCRMVRPEWACDPAGTCY